MDFLSSIFDPKNFAGITGLLDRMGPAMSFQPQPQPQSAATAMSPQPVDQSSPLDNAQWPYGPVGAPSEANAQLPANATPTSGVAPMGLVPPSMDGPMNFLGGVRDKINDNSNMLLGLAAGLAGGRNWGDGISKGMTLAMQGGQPSIASLEMVFFHSCGRSVVRLILGRQIDHDRRRKTPDALQARAIRQSRWPTEGLEEMRLLSPWKPCWMVRPRR